MDSELENEQLPISFPLTKYTRKVEYNWSEYQFILTDITKAFIWLRGIFFIISSLNLVYTVEGSWFISV